MRFAPFLLICLLLSAPSLAADEIPAGQPQPVELEFGGYRFGQSPAANMVCFSGNCKSQAPGGDGRVTFPFSIYETPGAVSTQTGMTVVNARYNFWEDRLYRVFFQVDCTPLSTEECLDDIVKSLDREYGLTPLATSDSEQFVLGRRSITKEFILDAGAFVKIRAVRLDSGWQNPAVDIVDRGVADKAGSTLNPKFTPKNIPLPKNFGKEQTE
ncbi:MAG: hypothetical protein NDI73_02965 [Desulfuromonadales bacterium]|nr:hypothetical protein [Desulfuromonadales bacterium]